MRRTTASVLLLALSGCYLYAPVGEAVPERGSEVKARLAPTQDLDLGEITVRDVDEVEGVVYRATPDSLAVSSTWLHSRAGARFGTNGAIFYFERGSVDDVQVRRLHAARSVVAVAAFLSIGAGLFNFIASPGGDQSGEPPKGPVDAMLLAPIR